MSKKYPTQVHERELFLAKQTETVSATQIRGEKDILTKKYVLLF